MEGNCNQKHVEKDLFKEEFKSLMTLIETGNAPDVIQFLDRHQINFNADLAQKSPDVSDLMFQAVQKSASLGHVEIMDALIFYGFNHVSENYSDLPPLHTACEAGHLNVVKSLVNKHGVNPDEEDLIQGITPLIAALGQVTENGDNMAVIQFLMSAGISTNKQSRDGKSPLVIAVEFCSTEICQLLISHGADLNAQDRHMKFPLGEAIYGDKISTATCLLDAGADIESADIFNGSPFEIAIECDSLAMMRLLQSRGARTDIKDSSGNTYLHLAALRGTNETAKYLAVEIGAGVDVRNNDGETPFMVAVGEGNIDIADMLVKSGYNPHQEELTFDEDDLILSRAGMVDLIKKWKHTLSIPRRLQDLCIFQIRRSVRNLSSVFSLPLPKYLIDEIVMNE